VYGKSWNEGGKVWDAEKRAAGPGTWTDNDFTGPRNPDHVLAEHARIHASDENAAGIRAASIRESTQNSRCAAVQQSSGVPGTPRTNTL